jgi:hypothetical protein
MASFPAMRYKSGRFAVRRWRPGGKILDPEGFAMPARLARLHAQWMFVVALMALAVFGCGPALAAAPYAVSGVPVDVTAADAATARDQAIVEGQRKAFSMLMEQLVGAEKAATIQTPSDAQLSGMVKDFEVESERLSSVRYVGVMTYRFDAASIDAIIGKPADGTPDVTIGAVPSGPVRTLSVSVPIASLRDWVEVRRRLAGIATVQRAEVRALARTEGQLNLVYFGDETQLQQALAQRQLSLLQDAQQWVLQLGENSGTPTGTP